MPPLTVTVNGESGKGIAVVATPEALWETIIEALRYNNFVTVARMIEFVEEPHG